MSDAYLLDQGAAPPSLSASIAKVLLAQSPLHAWHAHPRLNPNYRSEERGDFDYGTAAHALLLEGDESQLVVCPFDDWRKKEAREAREAARVSGKTPILARQLDKVKAMVHAAHAHIAASELRGIFAASKAEQVIRWQESAVHCRSKLDLCANDWRIVVDYKTTGNAEPNAFIRQIVSLGYDVQESFYRRAVRSKGHRDPAFVFLAQEQESPFACSLVSLNPQMKEIADRKVDHAIALWDACMRSGKWTGYPAEICYAEPPNWYAQQWTELLEEAA